MREYVVTEGKYLLVTVDVNELGRITYVTVHSPSGEPITATDLKGIPWGELAALEDAKNRGLTK